MNELLKRAEMWRILLSGGVLCLPIPFYVKVLACMIIDRLDCMPDWWPYRGPLFSKDTSICKTKEYSMADKFGDTVVYSMLLAYSYFELPRQFFVLLLMFLFRLIGVILFYINHDKRMFLYFPNFFITTLFVLSTFKNFHINFNAYPLIFVYQIMQEYIMHVDSS